MHTSYDSFESCVGRERGKVLSKFADLLEKKSIELASLETLDSGKPFTVAKAVDIPLSIEHYRYYAGYADKVYGQTIPIDNGHFFAYTLHEPMGVNLSRTHNAPRSLLSSNIFDLGCWSDYSLEFSVADNGSEDCTGLCDG